jgi:hypothetical protein
MDVGEGCLDFEKQLALDRDTTVQALMIEAANDLLRKYRRRPVAQTAR